MRWAQRNPPTARSRRALGSGGHAVRTKRAIIGLAVSACALVAGATAANAAVPSASADTARPSRMVNLGWGDPRSPEAMATAAGRAGLRIVDLGTLNGVGGSKAAAINDRGVVVGSSSAGTGGTASHAFVWRRAHGTGSRPEGCGGAARRRRLAVMLTGGRQRTSGRSPPAYDDLQHARRYASASIHGRRKVGSGHRPATFACRLPARPTARPAPDRADAWLSRPRRRPVAIPCPVPTRRTAPAGPGAG